MIDDKRSFSHQSLEMGSNNALVVTMLPLAKPRPFSINGAYYYAMIQLHVSHIIQPQNQDSSSKYLREQHWLERKSDGIRTVYILCKGSAIRNGRFHGFTCRKSYDPSALSFCLLQSDFQTKFASRVISLASTFLVCRSGPSSAEEALSRDSMMDSP